jgi:transposase
MGYIQRDGRSQGTLFPMVLDELVPVDHVCRVIDAFVDALAMTELGFERAKTAETGRSGYDPRDLLKLFLARPVMNSSRFWMHCSNRGW